MQHVDDVRQRVWTSLWEMACTSRNGTVLKFEENARVLDLQWREMKAFYDDVLDLPVASGYYKAYCPAGLSDLNEHIVKVVVMLEEMRILHLVAAKGRYEGDEHRIKAIRAFWDGHPRLPPAVRETNGVVADARGSDGEVQRVVGVPSH